MLHPTCLLPGEGCPGWIDGQTDACPPSLPPRLSPGWKGHLGGAWNTTAQGRPAWSSCSLQWFHEILLAQLDKNRIWAFSCLGALVHEGLGVMVGTTC